MWLNAILVANIEAAFIWFEVIPGHRPVVIAVTPVALLFLGVGFCWLDVRASGRSDSP